VQKPGKINRHRRRVLQRLAYFFSGYAIGYQFVIGFAKKPPYSLPNSSDITSLRFGAFP
jgi:hypothetical protein